MSVPKIKSATFSNRKKEINVIYATGKEATVHYGSLGISKGIQEVWVDKETGNRSLGMRFEDGTADYMPSDQPLFLIKDPEYMLQDHIEHIIARINKELSRKKVSKKHLARCLKTSDNQIQRLLNPALVNKNLSQIYKVASLLNLRFEMSVTSER
ncbi:MAG: hypothetical protein GKS04_05650 [Candidatus Mycalebacterium zealandia]|nr:MAG: hypothetical protein GKS04_05650 [Candidatus Mycalebacterium zealandia]